MKSEVVPVDVLAPWLSTQNLGDLVIRDGVLNALASYDIVPLATYPSHARPDRRDRLAMGTNGTLVAAGTNLLPFSEKRDPQFPLPSVMGKALAGRVVLLGVGWRGYSHEWTSERASTTASILSSDRPHSVRDSFTAARLSEIGVETEVTGCPTLWTVPELVAEFDPNSAVVTVTDYADGMTNKRVLDWAKANFKSVVLQPLGSLDSEFAVRDYGWDPHRILPRSLFTMSRYLEDNRPVHVGTRLHGGIRVLQAGLPSVIIAIDNRTMEMATDFNLRTCAPDLVGIDSALTESMISMPEGIGKAKVAGEAFMSRLAGSLHEDDHKARVSIPTSGGTRSVRRSIGIGARRIRGASRILAKPRVH